jgi:hypothetical protein
MGRGQLPARRHNYRRDTRLVDHQAGIPLARQWGGGELTSADGLRFVVPVRSIHAGPNPRYFGTGRGITLFNYVADNYLGWASIVVTGTARDSQFLLDRILDNPTSLNPTCRRRPASTTSSALLAPADKAASAWATVNQPVFLRLLLLPGGSECRASVCGGGGRWSGCGSRRLSAGTDQHTVRVNRTRGSPSPVSATTAHLA